MRWASITPRACVCTDQPCADHYNCDSARPSVWRQASCHLISTPTQQPTLHLVALCHFFDMSALKPINMPSHSPEWKSDISLPNLNRATLHDSHFLCCQRHIKWIQSTNTNSSALTTLRCLSEALHRLVMDNSGSFLSFSNYFLWHFCSAGQQRQKRQQRRRDGTQQRSRRRTCHTSTGITFTTFKSICSRKWIHCRKLKASFTFYTYFSFTQLWLKKLAECNSQRTVQASQTLLVGSKSQLSN